MSSPKREITVTIDGREIKTEWGKTILEVARENGIYIPTMCYLTKVEPIASCRMCVVNVEGVDGMILSCQEKAVDGAVINTNTQELWRERQKIMELYDVNHPLECGVCDKSGECELQNKTLEFEVDAQEFAAKDQHRPTQNWGFVSYDPSLCIMCERCVRVCNEIVGDEALQISVGGYKSTIINVKQDDDCMECGECMAVCPVGALVSTDFKYSSNAWELTPIPASCAHCSAHCQLYYEVKHDSIDNPEEKIYRVTNEFEYSSLCGAGRFGFDFENRDAKKDSEAFAKAVEALKRAESIRFASTITNEEALLLQKISEISGAKLVSEDAYAYQKFMDAYSKASGKRLYEGDLNSLSKSQMSVIFGTRLYDDAPMVKYHLATSVKREKAQVAYLHPIEDKRLQNLVTKFVKYEPGSEEGVASLLAKTLVDESRLDEQGKKWLESLDIGYISAESNVSEEELDEIKAMMWKRRSFTLIAGEDLYKHPKAENIAKILGMIARYSSFKLIIVPPASNTLGVSMICDLSESAEGYTVGYNAPGDFVMSALGDGDIDMPALNQQEGTFTTIDKRVVPTNAALSYSGYELLDVAKEAFGFNYEYVVDLTAQLPEDRGFKSIEFDSLPDEFSPIGDNNRGYLIENSEIDSNILPDEPDEIESYDGTIVYLCNDRGNFNPFTGKCKMFESQGNLRGSEQFAKAAKISDGERVQFRVGDIEFERVFSIDTSLKGTVAINPVYDIGLSSFAISSYRFNKAKIEKVGRSNE